MFHTHLHYIDVMDSDNESNNIEYDTVLETFYQKTDQGNGLSDVIAEQILTQEIQPRKLIIAPTSAGNFVNHDTVYLEEKAFPHLFPEGTGGYLSSYISKGVSFSNYLKMRLLGIDHRYSNDKSFQKNE